jgi:hypothetical protein
VADIRSLYERELRRPSGSWLAARRPGEHLQ